jgi:hypothetical protein
VADAARHLGRTTTRPGRDQVIRNLDVGSYYTRVRPFYFSLLVYSDTFSPEGRDAIAKYSDGQEVARALPHRADGLAHLRGVSRIEWNDLASALQTAAASATRPDGRPVSGLPGESDRA